MTGAVDSPAVAVACAANHLDEEDFIVILDSIVRLRLIEQVDVRDIALASPHAHRRLWEKCDGRAESGTETMVRLRLRALRIRLRVQVRIPGVGIVDFLVGRRLVIEVDGAEPHRDRFQSDRTRDRRLKALGFEVIRLTYRDVVYDWDDVLPDILDVIRRRSHLRPATIAV